MIEQENLASVIVVALITVLLFPLLKELIVLWIKEKDYLQEKRPYIDAKLMVSKNSSGRINLSIEMENTGQYLASQIKVILISERYKRVLTSKEEEYTLGPKQKFIENLGSFVDSNHSEDSVVDLNLSIYYNGNINRKRYNFITKYYFAVDLIDIQSDTILPIKPPVHEKGLFQDNNTSNLLDDQFRKPTGTLAFKYVPTSKGGLDQLVKSATKTLSFDPVNRMYLLSFIKECRHGFLVYKLPDKVKGKHHIAISWEENNISLYVDGELLPPISVQPDPLYFVHSNKALMKRFKNGTLLFRLKKIVEINDNMHLFSYFDNEGKPYIEAFIDSDSCIQVSIRDIKDRKYSIIFTQNDNFSEEVCYVLTWESRKTICLYYNDILGLVPA